MAQWRVDEQAYKQPHNVTLHETSIPVDRHGNVISGNYYMDIAKGKISGHSVAFVTGRAENFATPSTIWNVGGMYPWSAWSTGTQVLYINSTSASDTGILVLNGLDANYLPITKTITMNGINFVNTDTDRFLRLNSAYYISGNGAYNVGQINIRTVSSTGTIVGRINANIGQTSMSIYTIPAGYTGFSVFGDFSVNKNEGAELNARWRFFGGGFVTVYAIELYQQAYSAMPPIPGAIPEKTDIDNVAYYVTTPNGTRVYSNQQIILVHNDLL